MIQFKQFLYLPFVAMLWLCCLSHITAQRIDGSAAHGLRELGTRSGANLDVTNNSGIIYSAADETALNTAADELKQAITDAGVTDFKVFDYASYPELAFLGKEADGDAMMKVMEDKIGGLTNPAVPNYLLIGKIIGENGKVEFSTKLHIPNVGPTWQFPPPKLISKRLDDISKWINNQAFPDIKKANEIEKAFLDWMNKKLFTNDQFYEGVFITPIGSPVYIKFNWVYSFTDTGILSMWETQDGIIYQEHIVDGKFLGYHNLSNPQQYYTDSYIHLLKTNIDNNLPIPTNVLDGTGEIATTDASGSGGIFGNITIGINSSGTGSDITAGCFQKQKIFTNKTILTGIIPPVIVTNDVINDNYLIEFQGKKAPKEVLLPFILLNGDIAKGVFAWLKPGEKPYYKNEFARFANKAQEVGKNALSAFIDLKTYEWKLEYAYPPFFVRQDFNEWSIKDIRNATKGLENIKNNINKLKNIKFYSAQQGGINKSAYVNSILSVFTGSRDFMIYPVFKDLTLEEKKDYCDFYTAQGNAINDLHQNALLYVLRAAVEQNQHKELFNHIKGQTLNIIYRSKGKFAAEIIETMTYIFYESDDFRTYIQSPAAKEDIKNKYVYQQTWKNVNWEGLDFSNNKINFTQVPGWFGQPTTLTKGPYDLIPLIFNEDFVFMGQQYKANTPALVPAIFLYSLWVHETEAAKFDVAFTALEVVGYIYGVGGLVRAIRTADGALVVFRAIQLIDLGTHSYISHVQDLSTLSTSEKQAAKEWNDAFYVCSFALMLNSIHAETFEIYRNTIANKGSYLRELKDANGIYKYSDEVREAIRKAMLACQEAGTGCFVKGTPIAAESEMLPIEKITPNSKIWSWDIEKKELTLQKVSNIFVRATKQLTHIFVGKEKISTTPEHPFFNGKDWVDAKNLKKGAKVFLFSTLLATVDSTFTQDTICTVYNFEVEGAHNYFVGKDKVLVHNNDCVFYQRLLARIEGNSNFAIIHSTTEVADIASTGKSLGLADDVIDDLLFISCRSKDGKSINASELVNQMNNWVLIEKRGFPYLISKDNFNKFKNDLKGLLQKYGIDNKAVELQGSSVRTPNAKDFDIAVILKDTDFDNYVSKCRKGIQDRVNGPSKDNFLKELDRQAADGRLNSFYFDKLLTSEKTFNQELYDLRTLLNDPAKGIDISIMKKSANFLLKPTLKL